MTASKDLPVYPSAVLRWLAYRQYDVPRDILAWARTNGRGSSAIGLGLPWLNFPLIALLERRLSRPCRVFEWGAGGSTVFYAERADHVVTVEHDAQWSDLVRDALHTRSRQNVDLRHVPPGAASEPAAGPAAEPEVASEPEAAAVAPPLRASKLATFADYIGQIQDGGPFDIIQVDGKARIECAAVARDHLTPGGWLVVDDIDKPGRAQDLSLLLPRASWRIVRTAGPGPASGRRLVTAALVARRR